ncbi:hypothetical protein [Prescottella sp. R16]|uniref:hypothetical protein n=1 Tax=Prescottella sp. R16 TaxID=3064529 RepID=UPI00272E9B28|nr:hypothetical protein [Prescottella sp. R16]
MIKVNQVVSRTEAGKLRGADIVGICLGDPVTTGRRVVDVDTFTALQEMAGVRTSLYVDASMGYSSEEVVATVESLRPDYFEFTAVDAAKEPQVDEQLDLLGRLAVPKIANGFFVMKDDVSFLGSRAHLDRLVAAGVEYFQVETESLLDPGFRISAPHGERLAALFADYPCLVADVCTTPPVLPEFGQVGTYFNLGNGRVPNYDHSDRQTPLSGIVRIIRSLPVG